jgi:hypothetical protein
MTLLTCGQLMLVFAHLGSPNRRSVVTPWRPMKAGSEKPQRQTWGFSTSAAAARTIARRVTA